MKCNIHIIASCMPNKLTTQILNGTTHVLAITAITKENQTHFLSDSTISSQAVITSEHTHTGRLQPKAVSHLCRIQ